MGALVQLKPRHKQVCLLIAQGAEPKDACIAAGIEYAYFQASMRPSEVVISQIEKYGDEIAKRSIDMFLENPEIARVQQLIPTACKTLGKVMEDADSEDSDKINAAKIALDKGIAQKEMGTVAAVQINIGEDMAKDLESLKKTPVSVSADE